MAIRDLTILLKAWDSATEVLERVTGMADDLDQRVVEGSVDLQDNASKALGQIDQTLYAVGGRMDKVTASFDQVAGSTSAAGWSFSATSGKMQAASNVAERGSSILSRLSSVTVSTARGMSNLSDAL